MSEREMISRSHPENEAIRRETIKWQQRENDALRAENEKLREALSAERERCAKIAEQARDDTCDGPVAFSMADGIADAIRETDNGRD